MEFVFNMSCGHDQKIEVADPKKYLKIDKAYYEKLGLCDACWDKLHEQYRQQKPARNMIKI